MKFLDSDGVTTLWSKVKTYISTQFTNYTTTNKGQANGFASLDTNGKLPTIQLPTFKTINGESLIGSGNIVLNVDLYEVVSVLPTENINVNKIYLVVDSNGVTTNVYEEYLYVNNKWELIGKYKAGIDLTPYVKFTDTATSSKNGSMSKEDKVKLDAVASGATADSAITTAELDTILV